MVTATGAAHRAHQTGAPEDVHDLGEMVARYAVLAADLRDGDLTIGIRGQLDGGKYAEPR